MKNNYVNAFATKGTLTSLIFHYEFVSKFFCPLDLLVLSRVNKKFRKIVGSSYPDLGLSNVVVEFEKRFLSKTVVFENGAPRRIQFEDVLKRGYSIFGSVAICMLNTPFSELGKFVELPTDLDLFFSVKKLQSYESACLAIPGENGFLRGLAHRSKDRRDGFAPIWRRVGKDAAYGTLKPFALYKNQTMDLAVGLDKLNDPIRTTEIHIQRSPIPAQRVFLCWRDDLMTIRCEKISNLLGEQHVEPPEVDVVSDTTYFCRKLQGFVNKELYPCFLRLDQKNLSDKTFGKHLKLGETPDIKEGYVLYKLERKVAQKNVEPVLTFFEGVQDGDRQNQDEWWAY